MSKQTESMKRSVERDEQRVRDLQESIKARKEKIRELEDEETLKDLKILSTQGLSTQKIVEAIKNKDADVLFRLIDEDSQTEKSGN